MTSTIRFTGHLYHRECGNMRFVWLTNPMPPRDHGTWFMNLAEHQFACGKTIWSDTWEQWSSVIPPPNLLFHDLQAVGDVEILAEVG